MKKQAMLIMYHTDFYILERLLKQIDSEYFDIYLHVDKKVKDFDFEYTKSIIKKSSLFFVNRLNVKWGTFSQIECELSLLKEAIKNKYSYYHLLSGNDLLIKDAKTIYEFYEENKGMEYVAFRNFDKVSDVEISRIKYYHVFNHKHKHNNKIVRGFFNLIYYFILNMEKIFKINRLKNNNLEIRKGANWFSISHELVKYVLKQENIIYKMFKYSHCADELFLQIITYNSKFKNKIYREYDDELKNVKRFIDWNRGEPYVFTSTDYDELINSECFFARKFSSVKDKEIIDKIFKKYN